MPIDGSIIGAGAAGSGLSATTASVVNNKADTEAHFVRQNELLLLGQQYRLQPCLPIHR